MKQNLYSVKAVHTRKETTLQKVIIHVKFISRLFYRILIISVKTLFSINLKSAGNDFQA